MELHGCLWPLIDQHGPLRSRLDLQSVSGHWKGMDPQHRLWTQLGFPCIDMEARRWIAVDLCGIQRKCVTVTFDSMGQLLDSDGSRLNGISWTLMDCLGLAWSPWYSNTIHQSMPFQSCLGTKKQMCGMRILKSRPLNSSSCSFLYTFGRMVHFLHNNDFTAIYP